KPNETIEIGQINAKGEPVSLLRIPKGATAAPPLEKPGVTLRTAPNGILLSEVVAIVPTVTTEVQRGAIAVSWVIDTQPLTATLAGVGAPARLELGGQPVAASSAAIPSGAATASLRLPSELAREATLVVATRAMPARMSAMRIASLALAALALLVA